MLYYVQMQQAKKGSFSAYISSMQEYTIFLDSYFTFVETMIDKLTLTK